MQTKVYVKPTIVANQYILIPLKKLLPIVRHLGQ